MPYPSERKLFFIFEELVSSEMPPHVKGGTWGRHIPLERSAAKRELMWTEEFAHISEGFPYVCTMPALRTQ